MPLIVRPGKLTAISADGTRRQSDHSGLQLCANVQYY